MDSTAAAHRINMETVVESQPCLAAMLVDLQAYPIAEPGSAAARAFASACREELAVTGALALPGFLTAPATARLAAEARSLEHLAHHYATDHTVYFDPAENDLPPDHPRRRLVRTDKGNVPYDLIPPGALLRAVYEWDATLAFVAAVLDEPALHRHADPMAALNINVHGEGQQLGWHFDRADFAVTLSLQQSERGGEFDYVPDLRADGAENHAGVAAVLAGRNDDVCRLAAAPGTLTLFRGRYSLHRVTPSAGASKRLMAALSYVREPDVSFSPYARRLFYGREHAAEGTV